MNKELPAVELLNCKIHAISMDETVSYIDNCIKNSVTVHHVVVNAAKLVYMKRNKQLRDAVINCDLINADGQSLVLAARFLGRHLPERVAGIDLMENVIALAAGHNYKVFFLGATKDIVEKVVTVYEAKYGKHIIAGYRDGYYADNEEDIIARTISNSGAQILFVAMSSPKKEIFLNKYKDVLTMPFIMGVGGSFDVVAGKIQRAPYWMQKYCLEWLYRVIQEPRRMWKRYLVTNTLFICAVLKEKIHLN